MANGGDPIEAELDRLDAEDEGKSARGGARRYLPAALAVVTIAAFAGIVWYAYSTGVREGSEFAAPLLEPSGPAKVAPQEPGGREIPNQDKLVYGTIDGTGEANGKVERLLPPPENPLPLPEQAKPAEPPPVESPKLAVPKAPPTLPPPPPSITGPLESPPKNEGAKPETKAAEAAPSPPPAKVEKPAPAAAPKAPEPPKSKPVPSATATPARSATPDNYRIQIGSLRSEAAAKVAWERRVKEAGSILANLTLSVTKVDIAGKGTYFRVQGGPFADKEAAQRVCDALKRKKIGCFVVKP